VTRACGPLPELSAIAATLLETSLHPADRVARGDTCRYPSLGAILLFSLALKLILWGAVVSRDPLTWADSDMREYQGAALALLQTGSFALSPEHPEISETFRTPGYPAFLAAIYWLFGVRPAAAVVLQIFVSLGTIALSYACAHALWGPAAARLAALLLALDPLSFSFSLLLLTETLFTFLVSATALAGVHLFFPGRRARPAAAVGTLIGLAALVRPISYYLAVPVALGFLLWGALDRWSRRSLILVPGLVLLPFCLIVGSWQLRNYLRTGNVEFSSAIGGGILLSRTPPLKGKRKGGDHASRPRLRAREAGSAASARARPVGRRWVRSIAPLSHPVVFLRNSIPRAVRTLWGPADHRLSGFFDPALSRRSPGLDLRRHPFDGFLRRWVFEPRWPLAVFAFAFGYLAVIHLATLRWWWRSIRACSIVGPDLFLWGMVLYFLFTGFAHSRFRCPVMPILVVYAAAGLSSRTADSPTHRLRPREASPRSSS
jgi:4-amino-4-deoxy-L-arabinose transferase-like glycosyltransferase